MSAMGMMNEGYFVGRKELIDWIRQTFDPGFTKIEQLASGVVYCQIIDSVCPNTVAMHKVKMAAKTEVDFLHNFKVLQAAFTKKRIDRYIDVDKLSKKSFQYNMEFAQFMKCYWDMHAPNGGCGPAADSAFDEVENEPAPPPSAPPAAQKPVRKQQPPPALGGGAKRPSSASSRPAPPTLSAAAAEPPAAEPQLAAEVSELKLSVDNLERERDFYYAKLREVEVLCQANEEQAIPGSFLAEVLEILYKTDDADEFVAPDALVGVQGVLA